MAKTKLTPEEVKQLFSEIDERGVVDPNRRARERKRSEALNIDPLSGEDPSGSKVGLTITRAAVGFVVVVLVAIVGSQLWFGISRRLNTANLSESVTVASVERALKGGVEWGSGYTQFPEEFTIQEADETTGVIEVTVVDTTSENELQLLAGSQIQATAFATNALLNEKIDTVIYNVSVHRADDGSFQTSSFFGFLRPTGPLTSVVSFTWTKNASATGEGDWECHITGIDSEMAANLEEQLNSTSSVVDTLLAGGKTEEQQAEELEASRKSAENAIHEDPALLD